MTFLFWNRSIIAQHVLLPLKVPHRKIEFWIVFMFLYLFIHSLIHIIFFTIIYFVSLNLIYINQVWHFCFEIVQNTPPIYFHSKLRHRNIELELIYLNVYLDSCLFLWLNLIPIKHRHDISVWNHSIIGQHVFTSTQSASPQDWVLNCIYVYLFIHSLTYSYFFLLLFICFT